MEGAQRGPANGVRRGPGASGQDARGDCGADASARCPLLLRKQVALWPLLVFYFTQKAEMILLVGHDANLNGLTIPLRSLN